MAIQVEPYSVDKVSAKNITKLKEYLVVESPLFFVVNDEPYTLTMRTPGDDRSLTYGYLFSEGIIDRPADVLRATPCNLLRDTYQIELAPHSVAKFKKSQSKRRNLVNSSCGVCGRSSMDDLLNQINPNKNPQNFRWSQKIIAEMAKQFQNPQELYRETGGLHTAGLFDGYGKLLQWAEDIGRHNAVDKLVGRYLLNPVGGAEVLFLSGRVSFDLMQKAARAQLTTVCAFGAPSHLALEMAKKFNITLIAFIKDHGFNLYFERVENE